MKKFLLVASVAVALSGCAANQSKLSKDEQLTQNWTVEQIYSEARDELNSGNYSRAISLYDVLRSRQPEGRHSEQALLDTAYAYYKDEEPEKALIALARFQHHYPTSPDMAYALYLKGLVLFAEDQSFLNKLAGQDWSDRDPVSNRKAYQAFDEVVKRFPTSKYADDATKRMAQLVDALAGHEISIARYYAKRGAYVAANNRAQGVIEKFQNTRFVEEGLAIMMFTYNRMNQPNLAADTRRVLAHNFPNSPYLNKEWQPNDMPWWRYWK